MMMSADLAQLGKTILPLAAPVIKESVSIFQAWYKNWYKSYGEYHLGRMQLLQQCYITFCYKLESTHPLTTLRMEKNGEESSSEKQLPIYLQMVGALPVLYERGFIPKSSIEDWMIHLQEGLLRTAIEEMIGYLCEYQVERNGTLFQIKNRDNLFAYDPTNLFFEEFKAWLVYLSYARIDNASAPALYGVISGRTAYLDDIITKRIFDPLKENAPTRIDILQKIHDQLEDYVLPVLKNEMSRQKAREHFNELKLHLKEVTNAGIKFLFYIFRDSKNTPQNFILSQIRSPTMPFYKEVAKNTSAELLNYLLNTPMLKFVFPGIDRTDHSQALYEMQALFINPFSVEEGDERYPRELISDTNRANNWYLNLMGRITGIYPHFSELNCPIRLLSNKKENFKLAVDEGKEIVIVQDKKDLIIFYKNIITGMVENFNCPEVLKKLFSSLIFDGNILIKNQHFENIYQQIYKEVKAKGGYVRAPINSFLQLHSLLHKLSAFYLACDLLYEIAGDGGNLLVYGKTTHLVRVIVEELRSLLHNISFYTSVLHQEAHILKVDLDSKTIKETPAASCWRVNYGYTKAGHKRLKASVDSSCQSLDLITLGLEQVSQRSYLNSIYQKLELLERVVSAIGIKDLKLEQRTESMLTSFTLHCQPKLIKKSAPSETKALNEEEQVATQLKSQHKYTDALQIFLRLYELSPIDRLSLRVAECYYYGLKQFKEAENYLDLCISNKEINDYGRQARYLKIQIHLKLSRFEQAQTEITALLSLLENGSDDYNRVFSMQTQIKKPVHFS